MAASTTPRQLPLDLGHTTGLSRDELVVSGSNREAVALIDAWPAWPSETVVLTGPAGSGKTHLACVWAERAAARFAPSGGLEEWLRDTDPAEPIAIDDADRDRLDEIGLFHLINAVRAARGSLLLTARRFPANWGVSLPDLGSRLKAAATTRILEPDDAMLTAVMTKLFVDRQVAVEPHVVQFIARRIERSLPTAIRIVTRLDRLAMEQKSRITRSLAAEAISALDRGQAELDLG